MSTIRILSSTLLAASLLAQPVLAQNKAAAAGKAGLSKSVTEFLSVSQALGASVNDLTKRATTASPNDKEMLKLVTSQLSLVDATADGVLALGLVAAEVRDGGDIAIAKKHLATRCTALKSSAEAAASYVGSLANNIAAVATKTEANKARDLVVQMGQHPLCGGKV